MQKGRAVLSDRSKIEWTDATWNPIIGCSPVSAGCDNCYAERMAVRFAEQKGSNGPLCGYYYNVVNHEGKWNGKTVLKDHKLHDPLPWRKPRTIFVCSMGDLFHESVPDEWIDWVMAVIAMAPTHRFMAITKRPDRMAEYFDAESDRYRRAIKIMTELDNWESENLDRVDLTMEDRALNAAAKIAQNDGWPLPNLALGVSIENQKTADERIPILLRTPAAYRFVSYEPALGSVNLQTIILKKKKRGPDVSINALYGWHGGADSDRTRIDLVITGGESGPNARPMHPDWARSVRDQCAVAGVPFFFKQWGEWHPEPLGFSEQRQAEPKHLCWVTPDGRFSDIGIGKKEDDSLLMYRVGKKKAGRFLDGQEHNGTLNW